MNNDMVVNSDELYEVSSDLSRNNNIAIETGDRINPDFSGAVKVGLLGDSINVISDQMSSISHSVGTVSTLIDQFSSHLVEYDDNMAKKIEEIEIPEDFLAEDSAEVNTYLQTLVTKIDGMSINDGTGAQEFDKSDDSIIEESNLKQLSEEDASVALQEQESEIEKESISDINDSNTVLDTTYDDSSILQENFMLIDMIPRSMLGPMEFDDSTLIKDETITDINDNNASSPQYEETDFIDNNIEKNNLESLNKYNNEIYQEGLDYIFNNIDKVPLSDI